ncbi:LOW QUALITY PROTEIN: GATOR complex protein NPRL3-like [Acropora millepora]|uniref:LOW QUALITY PROTEIN: GATOR complex protein NPRL3-like n=1 Tax=Acropora millepora TaxID=45264 RepID=UPI001CF57A45|nr:LOW QUALITY PROTEIN: GATOR complex protein NPRL3-like [Acropora millepora]
MDLCDPVSIILVTAGSRGQNLLFRYPFSAPHHTERREKETPKNRFALAKAEENTDTRNFSGIKDGHLVGFSDSTLANILSPLPDACGTKFELKVDEVLFVGHPKLAYKKQDQELKRNESSSRKDVVMMKLFNVVFVLQATVEPSVVDCYHDLSKRIAIALKHEEIRCGYLSSERETMLSIQDEIAAMPEDCAESPFQNMPARSKLARDLKDVFESLCITGSVRLKINGWVNVSFCLPHKVHNLNMGKILIKPEAIHSALAAIRPYHTLLFLVDEAYLLASLPGDCSPAVTRLVRMASPLKSFQTLSQDTDIPLSQVFAIAAHLVYWGMATIVYSLCMSNVYVVAPNSSVSVSSPLVEEFTSRFPKMSLHNVLSEFSLPAPLSEHNNPLGLPQHQTEQVQMVVWMLQRRLLIQLHTYVFLVPSLQCDEKNEGRSVRLMFRDSYPNNLPVHAAEQLDSSEDQIDPELEEDLKGLTQVEKRSVLQVPAASNPEDLKLFTKLTPYFRGNHHLEEVMYYENLRRAQLLTLLDKFRDVLFSCQHEDPVTQYFYSS